jgi:hypothetical protein
MAKVIVERPRYGSRMRGEGKGYRRALRRMPLDEQPKREAIRRSARGSSKSLNEHLGPLRRYLRKQVGRPWNKVFAEICAHISRDSAVQDHVRDHVFDYVTVNVHEIDGVPYEITGWGGLLPLHGSWYHAHMYVCPRTGILKLVKPSGRGKKHYRATPELRVPIDHELTFVRKLGIWYRVRFEPFPKSMFAGLNGTPTTVHDAFQNAHITRADAVVHYSRPIVAKAVRRASREEIRRYCEPLKAPNVVR